MSLTSKLLGVPSIALCIFMLTGAGAGAPAGAPAAHREPRSNVLSPNARPHGYSLARMAKLLAPFTASGNDLANYPTTPFQILYLQDFTNLTGSFTVKKGTEFFVPLVGFDDAPPVVGDFPTTTWETACYLFGEDEVGIEELELTVDGRVTEIGPRYAAGPVNTPDLPDGGTQFIQLGVFLSPLSKGTHTITIHLLADGDALEDLLGGPWEYLDTYTVVVK